MQFIDIIDLTDLALAIIGLIFALASRYLIPWIKAKTSNEQEAALIAFFDVAVLAAEKLYGAGHGDEKLAYVQQRLEARGIKIDFARLKMYVNASIKKMEQSEFPEIVTGEIGTAQMLEEPSESEEDEEPQTESDPEGV